VVYLILTRPDEQVWRSGRPPHRWLSVAEGLFRVLLSVMRLREPTAHAGTPTGDQTDASLVYYSFLVHLPGSGWLAPAITGSRKRITGYNAGTRPLHHGSQRAEVTVDLGPARPSVGLWSLTLPYTLRTTSRTDPAVLPPYSPYTCCTSVNTGQSVHN